MLWSAVVSFRMSCQWFCSGVTVTAAASSVCDSDSSVWWIKPECHSGLSGLEVAVAFQSALQQGHTHIPTLHSLSHTHYQSIYLVTQTHLYIHTLTCTYYHTHSHTYTGFQALAAVIQDQFLPCKYSRSPRLLFIMLQCYSVALAQNACLALFRAFCSIHGARSPSSCLLGFSIVMLGWATYHKAHLTFNCTGDLDCSISSDPLQATHYSVYMLKWMHMLYVET